MRHSEEGIPACSMVDPDLHFLEQGQWTLSRVAKKICDSCSVKAACLEDGLEESHGIWGGMDKKERRREIKRREAEHVGQES